MITWNTKISIDEMLVQIKSEYIMSMFGFLDFCETPDWPDFFGQLRIFKEKKKNFIVFLISWIGCNH